MPRGKPLSAFRADLKKFARTVDVDYHVVLRRVTFEILGKIVQRTPVLTGRARANWQVSQGAPSSSTYEMTANLTGPQSKAVAMQRAQGTAFTNYDTYWVVNNLPYIVALETGHSTQAPQGMVRVTMAEVEAGIFGALQ